MTTTPMTVTLGDINAAIVSEHYFTAREGVLGMLAADGVPATVYERANAAPQAFGLLTICVLELKNGFTVLGKSACADPNQFNAEMGRKIALEDAVRQVWPLLGYVLREKLHAQAGDYRDRVRAEAADLKERMNRLYAFTLLPAFEALAAPDRELMVQQGMAMAGLVSILESRIAPF